VAIGTEITFTATDKSRYSNNLPGFFSVQGQASGDETLLSVSDLSTAFVFKNPLDDALAYGGDNAAFLSASDPVPEDLFAYLTSRSILADVIGGNGGDEFIATMTIGN